MNPAWRQAAFFTLVPASLIFSYRSFLTAIGGEPGAILQVITPVSGALSLVGLLLILVTYWNDLQRVRAYAGVAVALLGHYVLHLIWAPLGGASTYLGTGIVASLIDRRALYVGIIAGAAAVARQFTPIGHWLLMLASLTIGLMLLRAGMTSRSDADEEE